MKYAKFAAVVFVLYFLGYVLGPTIAPMLVKVKKAKNELIAIVPYKGGKYTIDLAEYREENLPRTVEMIEKATIPTAGGEGEVTLKKGDIVDLLNRKGNFLIVEKKSANGKGNIDPKKTDIYKQLVEKIYIREAGGEAPIASNPPQPVPTPQPGPTPAPTPAPTLPPVVTNVPDTPTPAPTPAPMPEPEPEPKDDGKLTEEQIVEIMKKSIAAGATKEIKSDKVTGLKAGEDETIDGKTYQIGLAVYKAMTILGEKPVQAKALIQNGKVEKWIYVRTGMQIQ